MTVRREDWASARKLRQRYYKLGLCVKGCGRKRVTDKTLCRVCANYIKWFWTNRKRIVLTHYGKNGKLRCRWRGCDVDDLDMLILDHIDDNGSVDRGGKGRNGVLYQRLIRNKFPGGYQTLCWNHQWKKQIRRLRNKI